MKKITKRIGLLLASPVLLFLLLASLLSLPPVQDFITEKATDYVHRETGLTVRIDRIRLAFPLDLALHEIYAEKGDSVVLDAQSLRVRIRLWPLLKRKVEIDGIELYRTALNTLDLISDTQIRGSLNALTLSSHGIDLGRETVRINDAFLKDGNIEVLLSDTAQEDTTPSHNHWVVKVDRARIHATKAFVRLPGDSMRIRLGMDRADLHNGLFDLGKKNYAFRRFDLTNGGVEYDVPYRRKQSKGFDVNHISLSRLYARIDSLNFCNQKLKANIRHLAFKERSGLTLDNLSGSIQADTNQVSVSGFQTRTPYSRLTATLHMDLGAWKNPVQGGTSITLSGRLDKRDLLPFVGTGTPALWVKALPSQALQFGATFKGNKDRLTISQCRFLLPSAFSLSVSGTVSHPTEEGRKGDLRFHLRTQNLNFIRKPAGLSQADIKFPSPIAANGRVAFGKDIYSILLNSTVQRGKLHLRGTYSPQSRKYSAQIKTGNFPVNAFVEGLTATRFSGQAEVRGKNFDVFSPSTVLQADARIRSLAYDTLHLDNVQLKARLSHGVGHLLFASDNEVLKGTGEMTLHTTRHRLEADLKSRLQAVNLRKFTVGSDTLMLAGDFDITGHTDNRFKNYGAQGNITGIRIITGAGKNYPTKDLGFRFANRNDTLFARINAGDLDAGFAARGSIENLSRRLTLFATAVQKQISEGKIDRDRLRHLLPDMGLRIHSGQENPVVNYMKYALGYHFDRLDMRLHMDPKNGIKGQGELTGFNTGAVQFDSTVITLYEDSTGLKANGIIKNSAKNNPYRFEALLNGYLNKEKAGFEAVYKDPEGKEGINVGSDMEILPDGIRLHLYPHHPVLAYRKFTVNTNNYIYLKKNKDIQANVDLLADDGTGLKIYSDEADTIPDVTVSVSRLNLGELTAALPFLPGMSGLLSGDIHVQQENKVFSAMSDLHVTDFHYDGSPLGNIGVEFSYLPDESMTEHYVDALILRGDTTVATVAGKYINKEGGLLNMNLALESFPMDMLNGFTGGTLGFLGQANGELTLTGKAESPIVDGSIRLDSLHLCSDIYGFDLHTDSQRINIERNDIRLKNMNLYSTGPNPLTINGNINFLDLSNIKLNLAMRTKDYEIINAPKSDKSEVYGKMIADYNGTVSGTTGNLKIRGLLSILGSSDFGYVLKDTPLSVEDRLSDLVTFVDFRDSTSTRKKELPEVSGIDLAMGINISNAARVHCDLSNDGQSYLDVEGGGNLTLKYSPDGAITLTGRYTANSGEIKYTLPVIPLRTFQLVSGSYIDFTGEPMNPTLNIQAKERVRASVNEGNNPRSVAFDVGVSITKQLSDMGLEFTIEAPEDGSVQNQLAAISREQRGKLAVSMLVTGMYLSENNSTSGFSANNALNAFLQSEIQQIAGNALKTVDLSLSVDNGTSADGTGQTDYSFRFAKRFWGNRVSFIIGGRVSSGAEAQDNNSFIDNVSLEYRLDKNASRYVRLYYNNEANDPLEGRLSELGGGIVLRRKATKFGNLFIFGHKKKK